jgi:hypothetical protein
MAHCGIFLCSQWTGHPLRNAHFQTKKPPKGGPILRKERQEVTN